MFKDRHGFNRKIRNGRRHVKIFPAGGDLIIPPRKISFYGSIQKEKGGAMPGAKLGPMLGENCPEATPTPEDSGVSFIEQSGTPRQNLAPAEAESSVQICPSGKSQLNSTPLVQETGGENFSMGGTIAQILIQGQVQSQVLGRQVGLFHQQQIYNN